MIYTNFKCYDDKGRRLSIFAEERTGCLDITVITCSKKDDFSKARAKGLYEEFKKLGVCPECHTHPATYCIPIPPKNITANRFFIWWCSHHFNKLAKVYTSYQEAVVMNGDKIIRKLNKISSIESKTDYEVGKEVNELFDMFQPKNS